jgi:hypothetical protein
VSPITKNAPTHPPPSVLASCPPPVIETPSLTGIQDGPHRHPTLIGELRPPKRFFFNRPVPHLSLFLLELQDLLSTAPAFSSMTCSSGELLCLPPCPMGRPCPAGAHPHRHASPHRPTHHWWPRLHQAWLPAQECAVRRRLARPACATGWAKTVHPFSNFQILFSDLNYRKFV